MVISPRDRRCRRGFCGQFRARPDRHRDGHFPGLREVEGQFVGHAIRQILGQANQHDVVATWLQDSPRLPAGMVRPSASGRITITPSIVSHLVDLHDLGHVGFAAEEHVIFGCRHSAITMNVAPVPVMLISLMGEAAGVAIPELRWHRERVPRCAGTGHQQRQGECQRCET